VLVVAARGLLLFCTPMILAGARAEHAGGAPITPAAARIGPVLIADMACLAPATPSDAAAAMRMSDADVRSAVDRELLTAAGVNSANVDVAVIDGIAILTGHTDTLLGRRRAAETAKRVAGARGLIDRLEVRAPRRCGGPWPAITGLTAPWRSRGPRSRSRTRWTVAVTERRLLEAGIPCQRFLPRWPPRRTIASRANVLSSKHMLCSIAWAGVPRWSTCSSLRLRPISPFTGRVHDFAVTATGRPPHDRVHLRVRAPRGCAAARSPPADPGGRP
jgi:hypothetical protein